jgi:hypothetical protein
VGCPMLATDRSPYEAAAWVLTRERIGWALRERYRVSKELPLKLLILVQLLLNLLETRPEVRKGDFDILT